MLELKNVTKTFFAGTANEKKALRGVSFTLEDGDFCTVIGSNGAGKSTTLNAIAGAFPIDSGSILIDGVDVSRMPEYKRAAFIGRVFQDPMRGTAAGMMISDPKTAAKVLELTEKLVTEQQLTTLMITHNMRDALRYGNRLIMMHDGRPILDVRGEEKAKLTAVDLLQFFEKAGDGVSDKMLLG